MGIIWTLIIGGVIGWLVQLIMSRDVPGGVIGNIVLGMLGSWLGGVLFGNWGWTVGGISIIPAIIGAILLTLLYSWLAGRR